ncbi:hypothetical protein [Streptomyces sp. NBC_01803]|uniref:hypothetical protein n=1 Tax=Streptomyces sp. NBC_01803 TaxID=2975946 RepID=UPI003FA3C506
MPASTTKLLTSAAALAILGPDRRSGGGLHLGRPGRGAAPAGPVTRWPRPPCRGWR